jgi:hypothetical protein
MPQIVSDTKLSREDLLWAGLTLTVFTEEELARQRTSTGDKVHFHRGVWWEQLRSSFCLPTQIYTQVNHRESWPRAVDAILGFMHLASPDSPSNSDYRSIARDGIGRYSIQSLSMKTRYHCRQALARVDVRPVERMDEFISDGHEVYKSWHQRVQWGRDKSDRGRFEAWILSVFRRSENTVLGAYLNNKLIGFMLPHATGSTAFMAFVASHSDYLKYRPNDALNHAFLTIARQTPKVEIADFGPLSRKRSLNEFKLHYGAVKQSPSYVWINPLIRPIVARWLARRYPWLGLRASNKH